MVFKNIQEAVTKTPVLQYYYVDEKVTIQCDTSQAGLGATLMQGGQPMGYATHALADTETRHAKIEKELLAIVFACNKFDAYIYGREVINAESDHQPLEAIMKKPGPLNNASNRLQRMLMQLQKYSLQARYKKGTQRYLADTLSRAFLSEEATIGQIQELEHVDHTELLAMEHQDLLRMKQAAAQDTIMQEVC